jgi:transposase
MAVERMRTCESVEELAKELGVTRRCLYKWRTKLEAAEPGEEAARPSTHALAHRKEILQLKRLLADRQEARLMSTARSACRLIAKSNTLADLQNSRRTEVFYRVYASSKRSSSKAGGHSVGPIICLELAQAQMNVQAPWEPTLII